MIDNLVMWKRSLYFFEENFLISKPSCVENITGMGPFVVLTNKYIYRYIDILSFICSDREQSFFMGELCNHLCYCYCTYH